MRNVVIKMIAYAAALWVAIWLVPGLQFDGSSWVSYLAVTALLVAVNWWVKPVMKLLGLPFILVTFGLFLLVINALALQLVVWLSDSVFELGLTSTGFFWATFLGALVISIVAGIITRILDND
jgi:putative membrane protein